MREREDFRLPSMIPIVFYNGEKLWSAVQTLREYQPDAEIDSAYVRKWGRLHDFPTGGRNIQTTNVQKISCDIKEEDFKYDEYLKSFAIGAFFYFTRYNSTSFSTNSSSKSSCNAASSTA